MSIDVFISEDQIQKRIKEAGPLYSTKNDDFSKEL